MTLATPRALVPVVLVLTPCDVVLDVVALDVAVAAAMVVVDGLVELPPSKGPALLVRSLAELPAALPPVLGGVALLNGFRFWYWLSRSKTDMKQPDVESAVDSCPWKRDSTWEVASLCAMWTEAARPDPNLNRAV
jgi:hypothetical protein